MPHALRGWAAALAGGAAQLAVCYFGSLWAVMVLSTWLETQEVIGTVIAEYIVFALFGLLLSVVVFALAPAAHLAGRWIWVAPVALLASGIVWDVSQFGLRGTPDDFIGLGEAGWVRALVTEPAWGCCWYSAAMVWHDRRRKGPR